jgi:hypothetical protein
MILFFFKIKFYLRRQCALEQRIHGEGHGRDVDRGPDEVVQTLPQNQAIRHVDLRRVVLNSCQVQTGDIRSRRLGCTWIKCVAQKCVVCRLVARCCHKRKQSMVVVGGYIVRTTHPCMSRHMVWKTNKAHDEE